MLVGGSVEPAKVEPAIRSVLREFSIDSRFVKLCLDIPATVADTRIYTNYRTSHEGCGVI